MEASDERGGVRLWPWLLMLVAAGGVIAWIWSDDDSPNRQQQVMNTALVLVLFVLGSLSWSMFFSRLTGRAKLAIAAVAIVLVGGFLALFRFEGVDGNLVPVFMPRWWTVEAQVLGAISDDAVRADFPQYLGANRDAAIPGVRLARDWEATPPKVLWRRPVGKGWSSFAVKGDRAITMEQHGGEERTVCYDIRDGRILWTHADDAHFTSGIGGDGPRATPTIVGDRVYTMGATGVVNALELESGKRVWTRSVMKVVPDWGGSCSPLVHQGRVFVVSGDGGGESVLALDAATGKTVWSAGDDGAGYASPVLTTLADVPQIVAFTGKSVSGHALEDGKILWTTEWPTKYPTCSQPLPLGDDRLLVSSGYGMGARAYGFTQNEAGTLDVDVLWRSARLKSKFGALVLHEGHVFGLDDGVLVCIDPARGRRKWKSGKYGHGQFLLVGDLLLIVGEEEGSLILVEANPEEHVELGRFPALDGKTWNPPALAGSLLLVRNDREAALIELPTVP